ncbi:efflux RND transporter periplasmic adaptor subunit [Paenibacillus hodogayensis]|uniref:Efflux RND transporter periplasmic adaptor subunit n=1 Tax=Paenibacillus hodogayensis TaxID=279208 RepID=A0ABV5W4S2_9BACL
MELQRNEQAVSGRKRKLRLAFGLFIGLLLVCTLFGNTLLTLALPKVTLTVPGRGQLVHAYAADGVVSWRVEAELTPPAGWKVGKVNVKEGDPVKKGQILVTYDSKAAEQLLLDEQAGVKKLKLSIQDWQKTFKEASQNGDEKGVADAKRALELGAIDLDVQERKVQKLQDDLQENRALTAPFDGIVMKVYAVEGLASGGKPDAVVANTSLGFEFEFLTPSDAATELEIGDALKVQVKGSKARRVEGRIESIQDTDAPASGTTAGGNGSLTGAAMKRIGVRLQDDELKGGERVQVELTRTTDDVILVPTKAIHDENGKKYVFGIEEKNGPLGNAFHIRKIFVTAADADDSLTAVTEGLFEQQSIVLESNEPLQEGERIRLHLPN